MASIPDIHIGIVWDNESMNDIPIPHLVNDATLHLTAKPLTDEQRRQLQSIMDTMCSGDIVTYPTHMEYTPMVHRERRLRRLCISAELLVNVLMAPSTKFGYPYQIEVHGIPPDYTIMPGAVHYDINTDSFIILIAHPSFAIVQEGTEIPIADVKFAMVCDKRNDSSIDDADPSIKRFNQY